MGCATSKKADAVATDGVVLSKPDILAKAVEDEKRDDAFPSFIESEFSTKVEYERWVAAGGAGSTAHEPCDVMIMGAGMAGLACALMLHKEGLKVKVFESAPVLGEIGAGINVTPLGVGVLQELGLGEALADPEVGCGIQTGELRYYNPDGVLIYTDPRGKNAGYKAPQYSMHRGKLWRVMIDALYSRLGAANLMINHTCTGFTTDGPKPPGCNVTAHFMTMDRKQKQPSCSAKILLGCDGIKSAIRAQIYPNEPARFTGWRIFRSVVDLDATMLDGKTMLLVGDKKAAVAIYGIHEGEQQRGRTMLNMGWAAHDTAFDCPEAPADAMNAKESWVAKVPKSQMDWIYKDWKFAKDVFSDPKITWSSIIQDAPEITCFALYDRDPVKQWTFGPVTLVGDAAHPLLPFGSQGANQAFLDAQALGVAVREEKDLIRALVRYEELRCAAASAVVMSNRQMGPTRLLKAMDEGCGGKSIAEQEQWVKDNKGEMENFIQGYHALSAPKP